MKKVWRVAGIFLLLLGLVWIISVMGGVFSHTPGFTTLSELWPALAFHTVTSLLGMACLGKSLPAVAAATAQPSHPSRQAPVARA